jgi:hypothetical protein
VNTWKNTTQSRALDAEAQRIGKMENAKSHLEKFSDTSAENALSGFHVRVNFSNFFFFILAARRFHS